MRRDRFEELTKRTPRRGQVEAVEAILGGAEEGGNVIVEAPTGTGKTLIAAASILELLERGTIGKAVLVAHTKGLQKQHEEDLRRCLSGTANPPTVAVLYGKRNYVCRRRLREALGEMEKKEALGAALTEEEESLSELCRRLDACGATIPTLDALSPPPSDRDWGRLCCQGCKLKGGEGPPSKCLLCEHTLALERAKRADVVLVNQSLLWVVSQFHRFPDPPVRENEGRGRRRNREGDFLEEEEEEGDWRDYLGIAGRSTLLVIDEAHELEPMVRERRGWRARIDTVASDIDERVTAALHDEGLLLQRWRLQEAPLLHRACEPLLSLCRRATTTAGGKDHLFSQCHLEWSPSVREAIQGFRAGVVGCCRGLLDKGGGYHGPLHRHQRRTEEEREDEMIISHLFPALARFDEVLASMALTSEQLLGRAERDPQGIPDTSAYSLCEDKEGPLYLQSQALTVARALKGDVWGNPLWNLRGSVCLSATLTLGGHFDAFQKKVGMTGGVTTCFRAPCLFDYPRQMELSIAKGEHHTSPGIGDLVPRIDASKGACLLLFTSRHRWDLVAKELGGHYGGERVLRAEEDVEAVTARLRGDPSVIVCGLRRYWAGLDVATLGLVVVDQVPFESDFWPRKKLMARIGMGKLWDEGYKDRSNAKLIQGIGRLIRDAESVGRQAYIRDRRARRPVSVRALRGAFPGIPIQF